MTHHQTDPQGGPLGPYAISVIRTVVPAAWGYLVAWLIHLGLPADLLTHYSDVIVTGIGAVVTALWYAGWRWLEVKIPSLDTWVGRALVALALGHPAAPSYPAAVPAATPVPVSPPDAPAAS